MSTATRSSTYATPIPAAAHQRPAAAPSRQARLSMGEAVRVFLELPHVSAAVDTIVDFRQASDASPRPDFAKKPSAQRDKMVITLNKLNDRELGLLLDVTSRREQGFWAPVMEPAAIRQEAGRLRALGRAV